MAILFYLVANIVALAAVFAVNLGWRPDFVPVWDGRAREAMQFAGAIAGLVSSGAVAGTVADRWKPGRFEQVVLTPGWVTLFLMLAAQVLSPESSAREVVADVVLGVGLGLCVSVVMTLLGFAFSFRRKAHESEFDGLGRKKSARLNHLAVVLTILGIWAVAAALILTPHRPDNGKIVYRADFRASCGSVGVMAFKAPLFGETDGVLWVSDGRGANQIVLDPAEWSRLQRLWVSVQAADGRWRAGRIEDHEASDPARLNLSVGAVARFRVDSRHGPDVTCDLPPQRFADFGRALDDVSAKISN